MSDDPYKAPSTFDPPPNSRHIPFVVVILVLIFLVMLILSSARVAPWWTLLGAYVIVLVTANLIQRSIRPRAHSSDERTPNTAGVRRQPGNWE